LLAQVRRRFASVWHAASLPKALRVPAVKTAGMMPKRLHCCLLRDKEARNTLRYLIPCG